MKKQKICQMLLKYTHNLEKLKQLGVKQNDRHYILYILQR